MCYPLSLRLFPDYGAQYSNKTGSLRSLLYWHIKIIFISLHTVHTAHLVQSHWKQLKVHWGELWEQQSEQSCCSQEKWVMLHTRTPTRGGGGAEWNKLLFSPKLFPRTTPSSGDPNAVGMSEVMVNINPFHSSECCRESVFVTLTQPNKFT